MNQDYQRDSVSLEFITAAHPLWQQVIQYITTRYQQAFDAKLDSFMPTYMALTENGQIKSLCGYRLANREPLFLEQYLDQTAELLLSKAFNQSIKRNQLIEFGQLASFTKGASPLHFLLMAEALVERGFAWCIFTATDPLYALMKRLGLVPTLIAEADPQRVPRAKQRWGSYYQHQPRIFAGNLQVGLNHLTSRVGITNMQQIGL
ncbi:thermostable hemolysin [Agarivorans sp. QJM3NY_33]|uniref:thermostable hemolysin n=1 Tax=Agarivorans sp. QJM3NY_33 TaxID=3421432 RepID=UPI003D7D5D1C